MTFFQFLVYSLQLAGTRRDSIAERLGIAPKYLSQMLDGRRLSARVARNAAELFRVPVRTLGQPIHIRDVRRLASQQAMRRKE